MIWAFIMADQTRWEGYAKDFFEAFHKAERETGKRAVYMVEPMRRPNAGGEH